MFDFGAGLAVNVNARSNVRLWSSEAGVLRIVWLELVLEIRKKTKKTNNNTKQTNISLSKKLFAKTTGGKSINSVLYRFPSRWWGIFSRILIFLCFFFKKQGSRGSKHQRN